MGSSCCTSFIKVLLVIFNLILLLLGIALVVLTALARWTNVFYSLQSIDGLNQLLNFASITGVTIALISIGAFIMLISIIGLFGAACSNKCLLITYEIVIVILFLAHITAFILVFVYRGRLEDEFKNGLLNSLTRAKNTSPPYDNNEDANLFKALANGFNCCGVNNSTDFFNASNGNSLLAYACPNSKFYSTGCNYAVITKLESSAVYFFIIPSAIILAIDFCVILIVPILISSINKRDNFY